MTEQEARALHLSRTLADALSGGGRSDDRLGETLRSLTRAAVSALPGVNDASITMRHADGTIDSYALTSDYLEDLDRWQYDEQEGPCYDGVTSNVVTICGDLANDPRYPKYGAVAVAAGVRSQAGLRLFESGRSTAALNLYSRSVGALSDVGFLGGIFSEHARTAIAHAREIDQLNQAVTSRQLVGSAVGILMERYQLSAERAFAFLARLSQDRNVKLRKIAEEIIELTQAPDQAGTAGDRPDGT